MKDKVLQELLNKYKDHPDFLGMNLDTPNDKGAVDDTPLHIASRRGDVEDIILFIKYGADINQKGDLDNTPLHFAAMTNNLEVAKTLLNNGAIKKIRNEFDQTPLEVAKLNTIVNKELINILQ
ncbi:MULTISPECIES: ankyrin repeat domain-containing protein [unclassified Psychrobacter]|uniref:ankyrin repeat domain-containing protein n=1 Tax=unclassified Psychrobacter TaxID=196806 RepID=UPI004037D1F0